MKLYLCVGIVAMLFLAAKTGTAKDFYIAQKAAGANTGTNCANAHSVAWFNSAGNWGSAATQISPGTTAHLCGTFTFPAGTPGLTVQGSGTAGNPITVYFESGASLQSPYFLNGGAGSGGGINVEGKSYITVDGGRPCGWNPSTQSAQGSCNGIIEDTQQGTTLTYAQSTLGVEATCSSNVIIQNLGILNMYVRTSSTDSRPMATDKAFMTSIHWDSVEGGCTTTNLTIRNNMMSNAGWHMTGKGNNIFIYNNDISYMDHGIASGLNTQQYSGLYVHDNHFHDMANWDDSTGANANHHDSIHLWGTSGSGGWANTYIYNNTFNGNAGSTVSPSAGPNAHIYFEYTVGPHYIFNNIFTTVPGTSFPSEIGAFSGVGVTVANNTMYGYGAEGCKNNGATGFTTQADNLLIKNNIFADQYWTAVLKPGVTIIPDGLDYNVYGNTGADCGQGYTFSIAGVADTNSLATWQSHLPAGSGQDAHARQGIKSALNLDSKGSPQTGSLAVGAGTNLTSLCTGTLAALCMDIRGVARPSTGPWDAGAFSTAAGSSLIPSAPTNLIAVPQ